jgi:DNA-binding transcriptional LysR family regulator
VTLSKDHALAAREGIRVSDLAELPLILMKEEHCLRRQSLEICKQSGRPPRVAITSSQLDTVLSRIETGFGVSFLPRVALSLLRRRRVTCRPVAPERAYREIAIVWPRGASLTRAERAFRDLATEASGSG